MVNRFNPGCCCGGCVLTNTFYPGTGGPGFDTVATPHGTARLYRGNQPLSSYANLLIAVGIATTTPVPDLLFFADDDGYGWTITGTRQLVLSNQYIKATFEIRDPDRNLVWTESFYHISATAWNDQFRLEPNLTSVETRGDQVSFWRWSDQAPAQSRNENDLDFQLHELTIPVADRPGNRFGSLGSVGSFPGLYYSRTSESEKETVLGSTPTDQNTVRTGCDPCSWRRDYEDRKKLRITIANFPTDPYVGTFSTSYQFPTDLNGVYEYLPPDADDVDPSNACGFPTLIDSIGPYQVKQGSGPWVDRHVWIASPARKLVHELLGANPQRTIEADEIWFQSDLRYKVVPQRRWMRMNFSSSDLRPIDLSLLGFGNGVNPIDGVWTKPGDSNPLKPPIERAGITVEMVDIDDPPPV